MPFTPPITPLYGLETKDFLLRPIRPADAQADYEAVMESRSFLRDWEQSSWPEDDFTVKANRADLEKLQQRHRTQACFTYTMQSLSGAQCLGCVYMFPPDAPMLARSRVNARTQVMWEDVSSAVYFWVRKSQLPNGLDAQLISELVPWLRNAWLWRAPVFVTNKAFTQQVETLANANLTCLFDIHDPKAQSPFLAFG